MDEIGVHATKMQKILLVEAVRLMGVNMPKTFFTCQNKNLSC